MLRVLIGLLAAADLVSFGQAVLRVPLRLDLGKPSLSEEKQKRDVDRPDEFYGLWEQYLLHESINPEKKKHTVQPLKDLALILVGFNLSIGTPVQSFKVALSIETDFLMLQSATCRTDRCQDFNHTGFNASQSSTFSGTSDPFLKVFGLVRWEGHHANETVRVGDLSFPSVPFLLADYISEIGYFTWYFDYDGVLGLTPNSPAWFAMKESGLLEDNIIGLKFPSGPFDLDNVGNRDDGELTLGGISPDFSSAPFLDLPLAGGDSAPVWATQLHSLTVINKTVAKPYPLPVGAAAAFVSADPFITLPPRIAEGLMMQVWPNYTGIVAGLPMFPCEMRNSLADVKLSLGAGDLVWNITLSPYEYSVRMVRSRTEAEACLMVTWPGEGSIIGLGWPFLRRFYSVFDNTRKLIRLSPKPDFD